MRRRIRCLWHQEQTASLVQYPQFWKCFGACGKTYTNKEVEERTGEHFEYEDLDEEKEDIPITMEYIKSLPLIDIRGLRFPADDRGYYVVWPGGTFYKYRPYEPGKGSRYIGPRGHVPPLFWATHRNYSTLVIVEGEINALSISKALPTYDVCSPGSASMFNASNLSKILTTCQKYNNVVVVLDKDTAGTKALIEAKAFFLYKVPFIDFIQLEEDSNEILVKYGPEELQKRLQRTYSGQR